MKLLHNYFLYSCMVILLSWCLPEKWRMRAAVFSMFVFLGIIAPLSLLILSSTTLVTYFIWEIKKISDSQKITAIILLEGSLLLTFKWLYKYEGYLFPLGMSYFIFRQLHYCFDRFRIKPLWNSLEDYITYLFFMPTLIVGPIHRYPAFIKDLKRRKFNILFISYGLERCLYGFAKIIILGDFIFTSQKNNFLSTFRIDHPCWSFYADTLGTAFNAYFQFAGYSDIAIGLSAMMGFRIMENFKYPLLSSNISEFWRRYHISLSSWCREYVFTPVFSWNRNAGLAVIASMLTLSLWHEISLRYFLWGSVQAIGILATTILLKKFSFTSTHKVLNHGIKYIGIIWVIHFFAFSYLLIKYDNLTIFFNTIQQLTIR